MRALLPAAVAALFALPAVAHDGVKITDPYVRAMGTGSGAAYFLIENHSEQPDRLLSVTADLAERAELHTSKADAAGMMQMLPLPDGIPLPPVSTHALAQGGDHLMLFGLPRLSEGDVVTLTLTFQRVGEVVVEAPVDNHRQPNAAAGTEHSGH